MIRLLFGTAPLVGLRAKSAAGLPWFWAVLVLRHPAKRIMSRYHQNLPEPFGVTAETFAQDIHAQKGLTCASCHGGDPDSNDPDKAMSRAAKWKGKIERHQVPELCASCHSNAELIETYNPTLRVDQFQQYKTSVHGKKWAAGDEKVAVARTATASSLAVRATRAPLSTLQMLPRPARVAMPMPPI